MPFSSVWGSRCTTQSSSEGNWSFYLGTNCRLRFQLHRLHQVLTCCSLNQLPWGFDLQCHPWLRFRCISLFKKGKQTLLHFLPCFRNDLHCFHLWNDFGLSALTVHMLAVPWVCPVVGSGREQLVYSAQICLTAVARLITLSLLRKLPVVSYSPVHYTTPFG